MNKRIQELADQAIEDMPGGAWNIPDEFCKKFAELIVQECIDQFCQSGAVSTDGSIVVGVKKHFGIE